MAKKTIIGTCKLCFENKELSQGHLMPRWASRLDAEGGSLYRDSSSRMLDWKEGDVKSGLVAEYLFCEDCDNTFGVGEGFLREIIHPPLSKRSSLPKVHNFILELKDEVKIEQLYCAIGGLLLKCHLSQQKEWKDFFLTKKQRNLVFNGIKNLNLSQNIKLTIFKIYRLENFKIGHFGDKLVEAYVFEPCGLQAYIPPYLAENSIFRTVLVFGGLAMQIDFHPRGYAKSISSKKTNRIAIIPIDIRHLVSEDGYIDVSVVPQLLWTFKIDIIMDRFNKTPLDSKCPCKVQYTNNGRKENLRFENCCYKYWEFEF